MTTNNNTQAKKMADLFKAGNIPAKHIDVFGRHCIVTCFCFDTARKVAGMLQAAGWNVKGPGKSIDYTKRSEGKTPEPLTVYRVWGNVL